MIEEKKEKLAGLRRSSRGDTIELGLIRMYLDDLVEVEKVLKAHGERLDIEAGDYDAAEVADLTALPIEVIHDLVIRSMHPYVTVRLSPSGARIHHGGDTLSMGISSQVASILRRCTRQEVPFLATVLPSALAGFLIPSALHGNYASVAAVILLWTVFGILVRRRWNDGIHYHSTIILKKRVDSPSFWKRNQDTITLHIVNTVISLVLGSIGTYVAMAGKWTESSSGPQPPPVTASQPSTKP